MSSFYVTLPSNSSMNYFPENTLTHFTTKLKLPLELHGKYEVALTEIIYPFNFKFRNDGMIYISNSVTNQKEEYKIQFYAFESLSDLFTSINDFTKVKNVPVTLNYNKRTYKASIKISPPWAVELTNAVHKEFGFRYRSMQADKIDAYYTSTHQLPSQLNSISAFYIYSDIVDFQFVGDTFAPILRVVPVANKQTFGEYICESYTAPHYVPVKRSVINTIEIDIKSDTGEAIQFNSGKLMVKLHFRPVQNGL